MKFLKPSVGDRIWILPRGNAARRSTEPEEWEVLRVGRKYFYARPTGSTWAEDKFSLDGWWQETEFAADYQAFPSLRELEQEVEGERLRRILSADHFGAFRDVPLEDLREACRLLRLEAKP